MTDSEARHAIGKTVLFHMIERGRKVHYTGSIEKVFVTDCMIYQPLKKIAMLVPNKQIEKIVT